MVVHVCVLTKNLNEEKRLYLVPFTFGSEKREVFFFRLLLLLFSIVIGFVHLLLKVKKKH